MKILVFAHRLELGGTQVNAIELSAALRDFHGHEVTVFATPGPMNDLVRSKQLRFIEAPDARFHPSLSRMRALREVVRNERPDVIHVWDWWQCLEAYFSVHLPLAIPLVVTDMMMNLTRVLPRDIASTFGTPELVAAARIDGRNRAELLLPPVDTLANAPGAADGDALRSRYGIGPDEVLVVTVSRLANFMKLDSLVRTICSIERLACEIPLRFLLVGGGAVHQQLQDLADKANARLGRVTITLTGPVSDPRPAYQAADIVVGMGGSALRGMSFAKPVVIVGERGFARIFSPESESEFHYQGMYGLGSGKPGNPGLEDGIRKLASSASLRMELGNFARSYALRHHSLEVVSSTLSRILENGEVRTSRATTFVDIARTVATYLRELRFTTPSRDKYSRLPSEVCRDTNAR